MKKLCVLFSIFYFLFSNAVYAHGGVSKNINNAVVYLNQTPLSPLVGEKVDMSFSITDAKFAPVAEKPVSLSLIKSFLNQPSADQQILRQDLKTDENGNFDFSYKFQTGDYYDIELTFDDPVSGQTDTTGFLIQPRNQTPAKFSLLPTLTALIAGVSMGLLIGLKRKKNP